MKKILLFPALCFSLQIFAQKSSGRLPEIIQVTSAATEPGEAVLVRGENLDLVTGIEISTLPDNEASSQPSYLPVPKEDQLPLKGTADLSLIGKTTFSHTTLYQQNPQSVKFLVPRQFKSGVYFVRLKTNTPSPPAFLINAPKLIWAISEEGQCGFPGGSLRIQGKNLFKNGYKGTALLKDGSGQSTVLPIKKVFDGYSIEAEIPPSVAPGNYQLFFHNGRGGTIAWSEPLSLPVVRQQPKGWTKKTLNVKDFGATGDGVHNETAAFRAALDAAGKNGGATVFVPRGRYMLQGALIIPPNTLLQGESLQLVQLFWNPLEWETGKLPLSLLSGTHNFGIKNLNLWASRAIGLITTTGPLEQQGNVTLENLAVHQSWAMSGLVYQNKANRDIVEAELHKKWTRSGIILRGKINIKNCTFNTAGMYTFYAATGFIQNCRFTREGTGINQPYMLVHPKGLIFEDCYKQADGYGYASSIDESYNLYEARNTIPYNYTNDRECMTLDGGSGGYYGTIHVINDTVLLLPKNAQTHQWQANKWKGGGFFILNGKGAGQFRRIARHTLDTIVLDQPFLVAPDEQSYTSITTVRHHLFFINNRVSNAGAYQFYGSAQNGVIDGLIMDRCNGIVSRGSLLYYGKQPNWYIDIVNCKLSEGNYSHWFGISDRHSGNQNINIIGTGESGINMGALIRNNRFSEFSYLRTSPGANPSSVNDIIIEKNRFNIAKTAIQLGGTGTHTNRALINNNSYKEVSNKIETGRLDKSAYLIINE